MVRKRVLVSGSVQGVFYRDACSRLAAEQGVAGWVRNLPDGRVEAVFEGEPARPLPERVVAIGAAVLFFAGGGWLLLGGPGSGRTTALQTLLVEATARLAPEQLHVHVLDHAGGTLAHLAAGLPHAGHPFRVREPGDQPGGRGCPATRRARPQQRQTPRPDDEVGVAGDPQPGQHLLAELVGGGDGGGVEVGQGGGQQAPPVGHLGGRAGGQQAHHVVGVIGHGAAGGDPGEIEKAKSTFKCALLGYALAILAPVLLTVVKDWIGG